MGAVTFKAPIPQGEISFAKRAYLSLVKPQILLRIE